MQKHQKPDTFAHKFLQSVELPTGRPTNAQIQTSEAAATLMHSQKHPQVETNPGVEAAGVNRKRSHVHVLAVAEAVSMTSTLRPLKGIAKSRLPTATHEM